VFYILVWGGVDDTMADQISEWIIGNKSLETLDLSSPYNKLTEKGGRIILEAAAKSNLKEMNLDDDAIPLEWKGLSLDEIRQFITAKNKQSTLNNQLKLLILGKERHGKTSLLHFLQQNKSIGSMTESTDGIDISQWILKRNIGKNDKSDGNDKNEIIFSCWDFAGQRVCLISFYSNTN
jgi:hypothetical protein